MIDWLATAQRVALSGHALFGASTLPRLFRCRRSTREALFSGLPDRDEEYTKEGIRAHKFADFLLRKILSDDMVFEARRHPFAEDCAGTTIVLGHSIDTMETIEVDAPMATAIQQYVDVCLSDDGIYFIEKRLDLSARMGIAHQFGTTDFGCVDVFRKILYVTDLKFGKGVKIFAKWNEQLLGYALALYDYLRWQGYEIETIVIRIAQPRMSHFDEFTLSVEELLAWAGELRQVVAEAMSEPPPPFNPGEKQCQFCPITGLCVAQAQAVGMITESKPLVDFDSGDKDGETVLTGEQLAVSISQIGFVRSWLTATHKKALTMELQNPKSVPGWKAVERSTHRKFRDDVEAEIQLRKLGLRESQIIKRQLVSPAQSEDLLKGPLKKKLKELDLWWSPPGAPVLVPESDPRPRFDKSHYSGWDDFDIDEAVEADENFEQE